MAQEHRRWDERVPTYDVMNTYPADYKVIFVGDAAISPDEIMNAGRLGRALERGSGAGPASAHACHLQARSVAEPHDGALLERARHPLKLVQQIMGNRMYPLTLDGIDAAIMELMR